MAIDELDAELAALDAELARSGLTEAEAEAARKNAARAEKIEALAALARTRRENDMATRERAARTKAGSKYLVSAVDLVALFPLGKAPGVDKLPTGGVIVVRNPAPDVSDRLTAAVELKKQSLNAMMVDVLLACTVDPDDDDATGGVTLQGFCAAFPDAASQAAVIARELGGAKQKADKRGNG